MSCLPLLPAAALTLLAALAAGPFVARYVERARALAPFQGEWVDARGNRWSIHGNRIVVQSTNPRMSPCTYEIRGVSGGNVNLFLRWQGNDGVDRWVGPIPWAYRRLGEQLFISDRHLRLARDKP
jgi:hypothetical protein